MHLRQVRRAASGHTLSGNKISLRHYKRAIIDTLTILRSFPRDACRDSDFTRRDYRLIFIILYHNSFQIFLKMMIYTD